jgi:outer membrane protein assembly factor BamB
MILASEKKEVYKYNPRDQKYEWRIELENRVAGISRIDNFVLVSSHSWTTYYTSLIDYSTGDKIWTINKILYSIHILGDSILYMDKTKELVSISINTGKENFRVKTGFRWSTPKLAVVDGKVYLFSSKKTNVIDPTTGSIRESRLPSKLDAKEITFILDEFQININTIPTSEAGYVPIMDTGFAGDGGHGGDMGGGDGGGGGE